MLVEFAVLEVKSPNESLQGHEIFKKRSYNRFNVFFLSFNAFSFFVTFFGTASPLLEAASVEVEEDAEDGAEDDDVDAAAPFDSERAWISVKSLALEQ